MTVVEEWTTYESRPWSARSFGEVSTNTVTVVNMPGQESIQGNSAKVQEREEQRAGQRSPLC
jgi:hypothetical protein